MLDLLIKRGLLLTLKGKKRRGFNIDLGIQDDCDIAIKDGTILKIGKNIEEESRFRIDARGRVVIPGFIDAHTHTLFGGARLDEFEMKIRGLSYEEIKHRGGGIINTVEKTRALSEEEMVDILRKNLKKMSRTGTTTAEVKSGYGLNYETEMNMLRAMKDFTEDWIDIVPTYMGAHEFPEEKTRKEYIDEITTRHLPEVASESLADFCDVFCEDGVYGKKEARRILSKAKELNLNLKIHADELKESGGAELAGELGVTSAEHLIHPSKKGIKLMKDSGVIAVLLPTASFILSEGIPPIEEFRKNGIPMALGSDFNPGSSPVSSMSLVIGFACYHYGMTVEEAIAGATINAAYALKRENRIGSIEEGKEADLLVLKYRDYREIPYWLGNNPVKICIKCGRVSFEREND